jgi:17beta-estradiol 17-dehydrogenase / very-long-chain 3-oxoacyl-CoA reductase
MSSGQPQRIVAPKREHDLLRWFFRDFAPTFVVPALGYYALYRILNIDVYKFLVLAFVISKTLSVLRFLHKMFIRRGKNVLEYGKWAVVTGATAGIGKGFAEELAARGMNVVLISRSIDKLNDVAKEIEQKYKVATKVFAADFTKIDDATYKQMYQFLEPIKDLGVLVNNVGVANEDPEYFLELSDKTLYDMININVKGTISMTRTVLPLLVRNKKGAVINVSSASGGIAAPMLSVYSATKSFITQFSSSLALEYKEFGIDILASTPYYVVSNLSKIKKSSLLVPSAEQCASDTLKYLGNERVIDPYWVHAVFDWVLSVYPKYPENSLRYMKKVKARADARKVQLANSPATKKDQ